jgi:hypothetical protein
MLLRFDFAVTKEARYFFLHGYRCADFYLLVQWVFQNPLDSTPFFLSADAIVSIIADDGIQLFAIKAGREDMPRVVECADASRSITPVVTAVDHSDGAKSNRVPLDS